MNGEIKPMKIAGQIEDAIAHNHWTRSVAAGSLVISALLLISGRRKSGIAIAAAGAAVALLENPEAVRDVWNRLPDMARTGHEVLSRVEDFMEELNRQGVRLRKMANIE